MPAAVIPAIVTAIGFTGTAATIAGAVLSLGSAFILSAVARSLAPKPKRTGLTGRQDMIRQPVVARRTIYGRQMVSGPIVFAHTHGTSGKDKNAYLNFIVVLAAHECEAIEEIWFNDIKVTFQGGSSGALADPFRHPDLDGAVGDGAWVYPHLGAADQLADSVLIQDAPTKWTAEHRLRGLCYLHVRLLFDQGSPLWADGIPNVRAVVKGKRLYDTRTATTAWSENPALCVYDYLTNVLGVAASEIDTASVNAAANECEEQVALAAGGTSDRYTCNGIVEADERPADVLSKLLSAMAGTLVYSGGTFYLFAGAATAATLSLDEDDLAGPITVHPRVTRRELFNAVKAVYVNRDKDWQPTDAPVVTAATYKAQDGGVEIVQRLDLPFTVTSAMAQRLALIELERMRQQIVVEVTVKQVALNLRAWDTVNLTNALYGWSAKKFRVVGWRLNEDVTVGLTLREEADTIWDEALDAAEDDAPDTNLPDPRDVASPGALVFAEELRTTRSGTVVTMLSVSFGEVDDGFAVAYELQFKKSTASRFRLVGQGLATEYEVGPLEDLVAYDFRVRAINAIGAKSTWTTGSYTTAGQTAPPSDVTGFTIEVRGGDALLRWTPVADVDLSHYRVRYSEATSGATWSGAVDLVKKVGRVANSVLVPALTGTYLIKAVDLKGNASVNAALVVSTVAAIAGLNAIATEQEDPTYGGTHSGTAVDGSGRLHLNGADTLAGWSILSGVAILALGEDNALVGSGTYTFADTFDLGAVYTSRLTGRLKNLGQNYDNAVSGWAVLSDIAVLAGTELDGQDAWLEVRFTNDDPAGSPAWSAWQGFVAGDYRARAFQFRARLVSDRTRVTPLIDELRVTIDMEDRVIEEHDLAIPAAGLAITYPGGAFKALPALGVSIQDLESGDYFRITGKSAAGFTLRCFDAGGAGVARTADYVARGYGLAA
jgi:hypothetical protein